MLNHIISRQALSIGKVIQRKLGYLKVPQAFRDRFGSPIHWPEPEQVSSSENESTVFLIYEFSKTKMQSLDKIEEVKE
jgi:hypothetical protein